MARLDRQAKALGAAMKTTHDLGSDRRITKEEMIRILIANLKESKIEKDEQRMQSKVGRDHCMESGVCLCVCWGEGGLVTGDNV